ncbi:MAG: hypothetical protein O2779_01380 [Nanoarchaeota archaeon]|nr:hypothetical protein [Nanoarchaeota archaeon]
MNSDRVMSRRFFLETLVGVAVVAALPGCLTSSRRDTSAKRATGRRHDPAKDGAPPVDGYFIGRFSEDVLNLIKHGDIDVEGNFFARSDALDTSLRNKSLDQQTDTFTFLQQSYRDVAMEYLLITANHNRHNRIEMGSTLEGLADLYIAEALSVSRKDTHHLRELIASDQKNFGYEREKHLSDFLTILEQRLVSLNLYDNLVNP